MLTRVLRCVLCECNAHPRKCVLKYKCPCHRHATLLHMYVQISPESYPFSLKGCPSSDNFFWSPNSSILSLHLDYKNLKILQNVNVNVNFTKFYKIVKHVLQYWNVNQTLDIRTSSNSHPLLFTLNEKISCIHFYFLCSSYSAFNLLKSGFIHFSQEMTWLGQ